MAEPRLLALKTPLGPDVLIPIRLAVQERLCEPYAVEVEVLSSNAALLPKDLLTQPITVTVRQRVSGSPVLRHFHGLVAQWERIGPAAASRTAYRLVAVPGIWRLGLRRNCRIFQDKSVKDIVTSLLAEHGLPAPTWGILPALAPMPYCTQFNESDLDFVSRLLHEHGLSYYFVHSESEHKLHISHTAPGFPAFEGSDVTVVHGSSNFDELSQWRRLNQVRSASVDLKDMDAARNQPSVVLTKKSETRAFAGEPAMWTQGKVTHWPGGMSTRPQVDPSALAMGAQEAASEHFEGVTLDPRFAAGRRVNVGVRDEAGTVIKQQYVITSVQHEASDDSALVAGAGGTERYEGSIRLVSAQRTWMPQAQHARPVMAGLHSAKVSGPKVQDIHCDDFGRIKIKFRWDSQGPEGDAASCWVRVAQAVAGAWGGTWFLPRVGDEVLVAFLDGDPDRPVVTGSLYNADARPPFDPKANNARSGISTRSVGGPADKANVLRFEDKDGSEEVLLHAQKDLNVVVENARSVKVEKADDSLTVEKGHRKAEIQKGNDTLTIQKGNRSTEIDTGNDTLTLKQGNLTVTCKAGKMMLEAMQEITLKVGSNSVVINQAGITVKGTLIKNEASAMHQTKAPMIMSKADGMVQVQGGIVMIN